MQRRGVVDRRGVAEQVGAVADDRHDRPVGGGKFCTQRCARSPAQPRGGTGTIVAIGIFKCAMLKAQRVLIDNDCVGNLLPVAGNG